MAGRPKAGRGRRALLLPLLASAAACSPEPYAPGPAHNALLVSIDTLRADRLRSYGFDRPTAPALRAFAEEGALFEEVAATSPWTLPSHASLLTGLYPYRHGVQQVRHRLPAEVGTLAERLRGEGFRTYGVVSSHHLTARNGLDRGFEGFHYEDEILPTEGPEVRVRNPGEDVTERALAWLEAQAERKPAERFFLFVHYYDPHTDYTPEPRYRRRFVETYEGPFDGTGHQLLQVRRGERAIDERDARHLDRLYQAEIRQLDAQIARLLRKLEESGLARSTAVAVTGDHGEEFLEHGSVLHGRTYYEEVIRVPLLLRGPGVPSGWRNGALASLVDVAPTLLGLLGLEGNESHQGVDLTRRWDPLAWEEDRRYVIAEADWMNEQPQAYRMIRDERYKLIRERAGGGERLYDLRADPGETRELSEARPEVAARLRAALAEFVAPEAPGPRRAPVSPGTRSRLRALGYVR